NYVTELAQAARITALAETDSKTLYSALGRVQEVYAVVPLSGKLYLARGAGYSYYEIPSAKPLKDADWQVMLQSNMLPAISAWTNSFDVGEKIDDQPIQAIQDFEQRLTEKVWGDTLNPSYYAYLTKWDVTGQAVNAYIDDQSAQLSAANQYEGRR